MTCGPVGGAAAAGPVGALKTAPPSAAAAAVEVGTLIKPSVDVNAVSRDILAPKIVTVTVKPSAADMAVWDDTDAVWLVDGGPIAGYYQSTDYDLNSWTVWQTAVAFDLAFLHQVPGTQVREAVLRFNESRALWKDRAGNDMNNARCVEVLGRATEEWRGRASTDIPRSFASDKTQGHTPGAQEWFVTSEIRDQWTDGVYPPLGFVLRGGNEAPNGKSKESCVSQLSDISLQITYAVPQ